MSNTTTIDPRPWLGDGNSVRIVSNDDGRLGRVTLEDSQLYEWFFDNAEQIDIIGISCSKFVSLLTQRVEYAQKGQEEANGFLGNISETSYIFRNILRRNLRTKIWFLSPDAEYVGLRRAEGDDTCRNNILKSIGRLRCLERAITSNQRRFSPEGSLEVHLLLKNPCFSVFRAIVSNAGGAGYNGTIIGIIGQARDVKSFPAIWIPARNPAAQSLISDHLANLALSQPPEKGAKKLFEWHKQQCKFHDWTNKWDVFISYNHAEREIVQDLHHRLEALGLRCFHDERGGNSMPGRDWETNIKKALQQTRCAIVCVGEKGLGRWQETRELVYLLAYKRSDAIFPVSLCPGVRCPSVPANLSELIRGNAFEFDPTKDVEESVGALAEAIRHANQ